MDDYPHHRPERANPEAPYYPGLEQLMAAALANPEFATRLLADPAKALTNNTYGLVLSEAEFALAAAIQHAVDIHDYATKLRAHINQQHGA